MRAHVPLPKSLRRLVALAFALVATLSASLAAAQLTTGTPVVIVGNYPQRWLGCTATCDAFNGCTSFTCPQGSTQNPRQPRNDVDKMPNAGINRADCTSDELWQFAFTLPAGVSFSSMEVWASATNTSCADPSVRAVTPPGTQQPSAACWRVARWSYGQVNAQHVVAVRTFDMMKAMFQHLNYDDPAMTSQSQICYPTGDTQPTRFYLHFLLMQSGTATDIEVGTPIADAASYESTYDTTFDLIGPPPPSNVTLLSGGSLLKANWTSDTSSAQYGDFQKYRAYCFPKPGNETNPPYYGLEAGAFGGDATTTTTDSGDDTSAEAASDTGDDSAADASDASDTGATTATTDTGTTEAAAPTGTCPPTLPTSFVAGQIPTPDIEALNCGESSTTGTSMQISPLQNGVNYAVAIATVDIYGNSGVLSTVGCLDPEQTRDFYDTYTGEGGQAGGGYCAFGTARDRGGLAAILAVGGAALFMRRRQRRTRGAR